MTIFLHSISSLVTCSAAGECWRTGSSMNALGVISDGAILMDRTILAVGTTAEVQQAYPHKTQSAVKIDCTGKTVLPGFIDSHTHMVFAGSRSDEFARRLAGVSYSQIAAEGGGILSTVNAVRSASVLDVMNIGRRLVLSAIRHGTTTIEIKSGYGLSTDSELLLLEAAAGLQQTTPAEIHITFLGAHDVPVEYRTSTPPYTTDGYVQHIIDVMLPAVHRQGYATACDVFADEGFFSVEQAERICNAAKGLGFAIHVHADEIQNIGASAMAARLHAYSADHLERTTERDMIAMRDAGVVATLLPGTAYTLRLPYPNARMMIDNGLIVALATDCNPGSNMSENMQHVLSLACVNMNMTIDEAITAATLHGAHALRIAHRKGSIEVGKDADVVLYSVPNYTDIVYHWGVNHVERVWIGGEEVVFTERG